MAARPINETPKYNGMKKTLLLFALVSFLTLTVHSQVTETIAGKWKFQEIYHPERFDSLTLETAIMAFKDFSLYLKVNNQYKAIFMSTDEGSWSYDVDTKRLVLSSKDGSVNQLEFTKLSDSLCLLGMGKNKSIILVKDLILQSDDIGDSKPGTSFTSITADQLCKKWFFESRNVPNRTVEQSDLVNSTFKGTYFDFRKDKTYEMKMGQTLENGTWDLGNDHATITLSSNSVRKVWNVKSVTATKLILVKGNTEGDWVFSMNE